MAAPSRLPGRLVLLGHPVAHSLSPRFQNAALAAAGISLHYEALDAPPEALPMTLAALRENGAAGNATIPHKERLALLCDRLTPVAERAGAVNTFWHEGGALWGDNTDVAGFDCAVTALLHGRPEHARIAVLGAGGAAAAVLLALSGWTHARVWLHNRNASRAQALAARFPGLVTVAASAASAAREGTTLVVNATSVGLEGDAFPVPVEAIPAGAAAFDLVYRRGETAWVRAARAAGHAASDGIEMLLEQGALAFERWFGRPPDRAAMRAALAVSGG